MMKQEQRPLCDRILRALLAGTALSAGRILTAPRAAIAATFSATSTNGSGAGSLRQAIIDADAAGGSSTITVSSALAGQTITLQSNLPLVSTSVTIEGHGVILDGVSTYAVF